MYVILGMLFAVIALVAVISADAIAIGLAQQLLQSNVCLDGFSKLTVVVMFGVAIVISALIGAWLYRFRHAIARYAEDDTEDRSRYIRRHFAFGCMATYLLVTPATWLLMLGMAYCNAGAGAGM